MEDFMCGGAGVAFSDLTNDGGPGSGIYRSDVTTEGPDLQTTGDSSGTYNLGWTRDNEWVRYDINVTESREYDIIVRVASPTGNNGQFHIKIDGTDVTGTQNVPVTGGWQNWTDYTVSRVILLAGTHTLEFYIENNGANYNYMNIVPYVPPPTNTPTSTPTNTPTSTPTPTPTQAPSGVIYVSSTSGGTVSGIGFADEDILAYNQGTGTWSMFFDGSDVGVGGGDVDAFTILSDGSLLLSFNGSRNISGVGNVDDSDIVRFIPSSTGANTSGTFEMYFDGSDVGLTTNGEDIDAVTVLSDGRIVVSTVGSFNVGGGVRGDDSDLIAFTPTQLGFSTQGSWSFYFDGSDVGLTTSNEDIYGTWIDGNGDIYLTFRGGFNAGGVSGSAEDIVVCQPGSLGTSTSCQYTFYWDGSANGMSGETIDALHIVP
ncbi:MAG: carbohydrate-binding protein [Chloroflexi bacterium]|nr:MAG: carbohydrate-binding protein [Chloroflexota bacterium]